MVDFPEVSCTDCSETDCTFELEEKDGLPYRRCKLVGLKPLVMTRNIAVWNIFTLITKTKFFRHYPFLIRDAIKDMGIRLSFTDLIRLSNLYNKHLNEEIGKFSNTPLALLNIL